MSTFHNPTTSTMGEERRRDVIAVARRHGLFIIEDDIYAPIQIDPPPPLATLAPELVYFIDSTSKGMAPGLRIGFAVAPAGKIDALRLALNASTWMAPPLNAEIAARWIRDGTAMRLVEWQRDEARARQRIVVDALGTAVRPQDAAGFHSWLRLPPGWDAAAFVSEADRRGVRILPADTFVGGRIPAPAAVRIGNGAARNREQLAQACAVLADIMGSPQSETVLSVM
jgi:DNA-binding transcriptional MocR family regulator